MCGIAGYVTKQRYSHDQVLNVMSNAIKHRGPDDHGIYVNQERGIYFAHQRLSILDLSAAGKQPMQIDDWVIVYNGEIYNHLNLRKELSGIKWLGHSDTETLLYCLNQYGLHGTLSRLSGMFAFAAYNRKDNKLYLARDRFGEKPLYYGHDQEHFIFASELKAIKKHPFFKKEINKTALNLYLELSYVPHPYSIYKNYNKLQPGHYLKLDVSNNKIDIVKYFNIPVIQNRAPCNENNVLNDLEFLLNKTIKDQMISDVPIGAFLSGGVDSSLVVAMMQKNSSRPIETFTIGFKEKKYNEAPYAKSIAMHLGTNHNELILDHKDYLELIPRLGDIYDEPFADSSQISTWHVCKEARKKVTVALSGDGGDEIFGGYNRYKYYQQFWKYISLLPISIRAPAGKKLGILPSKFKLALMAQNSIDYYSKMINQLNYSKPLLNQDYHNSQAWEEFVKSLIPNEGPDFIHQMMNADLTMYLPGDVLVKVDRASMNNSLETRSPYLNHEIFNLMWPLPINSKIKNGMTKRILRKLLYKYIPSKLIERPKKGFAVPLASWLRTDLKEWSFSMLELNQKTEDSFFNKENLKKIWQEHQSGKVDRSFALWNVLMFKTWSKEN
jgi:asparagine synthase (glutamine-hydrolysing)